jgi:hypothetical protein
MFTGTLAMDFNAKALNFANTICQPKYDGVRVQITKMHESANAVDRRLGRSVLTRTCTRSGNYVPNDYIRELLDRLPVGLDGELVAADSSSESGEASFGTTMSAVSAKSGEPAFLYMVYDYCTDENKDKSYLERMTEAKQVCQRLFYCPPWWLRFAPTNVTVGSQADIDRHMADLVADGYEGLILRRADLPHVKGRSSRRQPAVMRIKAWADCEARIVDVIAETWHDCETNRKLRPALIGQPKDFASSFLCEGLPGTRFAGQQFRAPLSVQDSVAREYLQNKAVLIGQLAKVRYLAAGVVDKPRLPVCVGVRSGFDCSQSS